MRAEGSTPLQIQARGIGKSEIRAWWPLAGVPLMGLWGSGRHYFKGIRSKWKTCSNSRVFIELEEVKGFIPAMDHGRFYNQLLVLHYFNKWRLDLGDSLSSPFPMLLNLPFPPRFLHISNPCQ